MSTQLLTWLDNQEIHLTQYRIVFESVHVRRVGGMRNRQDSLATSAGARKRAWLFRCSAGCCCEASCLRCELCTGPPLRQPSLLHNSRSHSQSGSPRNPPFINNHRIA